MVCEELSPPLVLLEGAKLCSVRTCTEPLFASSCGCGSYGHFAGLFFFTLLPHLIKTILFLVATTEIKLPPFLLSFFTTIIKGFMSMAKKPQRAGGESFLAALCYPPPLPSPGFCFVKTAGCLLLLGPGEQQ